MTWVFMLHLIALRVIEARRYARSRARQQGEAATLRPAPDGCADVSTAWALAEPLLDREAQDSGQSSIELAI